MFLRWNSTGLVLALLAVLLAGCGDDGSSSGGQKTDFEAVSLYPSNILTAGVEARLSGYGLAGVTASINGVALEPTLQNAHELDFITPDLPVGEYTIDISNDSETQRFPVSVKPRFEAIDVSAADHFTCAVRQDGTVWCWGKNYAGQLGDSIPLGEEWFDYHNTPVQISGIENAVEVESGYGLACALLQDHSVKCWGANGSSRPVSVYGINEAISISLGSTHACVLLSDQTVKCWGSNDYGQLGNGIVLGGCCFPYVNEPVLVEGIDSAVAIDAGSGFTCAVLSDKTVKCWGENYYGQLGNGLTRSNSSSPVDVIGIATAVDISVGASHACAVLEDNAVRCWGHNESGALGDGTENDSAIPVAVTGIDNAVNVYTGLSVSCAILADKTVRCWGANYFYGYFGVENLGFSLEPVLAMPGLTEIATISFSYRHSCALQMDAQLYCWGEGMMGELGNSLNYSMAAPVTLKGEAEINGLALWYEHDEYSYEMPMNLCLLKNDGAVMCRGHKLLPYNNDGQKYYSPFMSPEFSAMEGVNTAVEVITGPYLPCILLENGEIACRDWDDSLYTLSGISNAVDIFQGRNSIGYALLGDGGLYYIDRRPLFMGWHDNLRMVGSGLYHNCMVLTNNRVWCWGSNNYGQLASHLTLDSGITPVQAEGVSSAVSVAVTDTTSCALLKHGGVVCWGSNESGQLGRNISGEYTYDPAPVRGLNHVTSIAGGSDHFCAIKSDGSAWCWGSNRNGQLGNPMAGSGSIKPVRVAGIINAVSIVAHDQITCAVLADGYAQCWGVMNDLYRWETPVIPVYMP